MRQKGREAVAASTFAASCSPNQSLELLKTLHLLTREGHLNADARRKLKQVNHFVGLLQPALDDVLERFEQPVVVDVGSGNAYLGFVLYELFFKGRAAELRNVESRAELVEACEGARHRAGVRAHALSRPREHRRGVPRAHPRADRAPRVRHRDRRRHRRRAEAQRRPRRAGAVLPGRGRAAAQRRAAEGRVVDAGALLAPWHRREFGSHLTNVIRALLLESFGYQVTVTELAGWEHSLKNELILARRVHKENRMAKERLDALLQSTGVSPKLRARLGEAWVERNAFCFVSPWCRSGVVCRVEARRPFGQCRARCASRFQWPASRVCTSRANAPRALSRLRVDECVGFQVAPSRRRSAARADGCSMWRNGAALKARASGGRRHR